MKLYMLPVIISLLAAPYSANAAWQSGNELLSLCEEGEAENWTHAGICLGYIVGVADSLKAGNSINGYTARFTSGVTQGQLQRIVVKYLKEHPEELHLGAAGLVAAALSEAFP